MSIFDFSYEFPSTIEELDKFNGKEFEVFLFEFFKVLGYKSRLTDDSNDKGIDLIVEIKENDGFKRVGIQAKRWKSKVGASEIRNMLDGREHYSLDEVWIVTTSNLTSSAITTAMNNRIEIVNRDRVKQFLTELEKLDDIVFRKKVKKETKTKTPRIKEVDDKSLFHTYLKKTRTELAQKHKLYPVYLVFNNAVMDELIKMRPENLSELKNVKGFSPKNVEIFGSELIGFIKKYSDTELKMKEELINIRQRIQGYNKIKTVDDTFNDETLNNLITYLPTSTEELKAINGFRQEGINLFGEYLIKQLSIVKDKFKTELNL